MKYEAISVSELNQYIKEKIANDEMLNNVLIKGEISNFKNHYTGHLYFTLKDDHSLIKCIMFKTYTSNLKFKPRDGMKVMVFGTVSVFERDGVYQIYCKAMQEDGMGSLYTAYEELKQKLEKEGLFDIQYKKKIPYMPKVVGVLTSQTGSVIRDIINVSTRRNPNVYIRLLPVPVQGEGAGIKIAEAIQTMNEQNLADVIILARGGGSLEDLWPFNEEVVARAIFASKLPVISAVGHETDFTIADFVADLRAPTPSSAAELAVADVVELEHKLTNYQNRFKISLKKKVEFMRLKYEKCISTRAFKEPLQKINEHYVQIDMLLKTIEHSISTQLNEGKNRAAQAIAKLDALSPLKTLTRGYCIAQMDNKAIKSAEAVKAGDEIQLKFVDGNRNAKIV